MAPRLWCASSELIEVNNMVAREVATAICTAMPAVAGSRLNNQLSTGTRTNPPPMPQISRKETGKYSCHCVFNPDHGRVSTGISSIWLAAQALFA